LFAIITPALGAVPFHLGDNSSRYGNFRIARSHGHPLE